jgi:phage terminase large subunit
MAIALVQKHAGEVRVIDYIEDSHKTLDHYAQEILARRYNLGSIWLPHDGFHKDFKTGKSAAEIMEAQGFTVGQVPNVSVHEGITTARMAFRQAFFDEAKAARLIVCLKRYARHINSKTLEAGSPVHDQYSHGADNWRYAALVADQMGNAASMPAAGFKRRGSGMAV